MAEAMTYSSLVQDVQDYCERNDSPFINQIPRFIMMAENRIASETKPLGFLRTVTGKLNGSVLEKPARWRQTKNFSITVDGERKFLRQRSYEYCREYWPDPSVTDEPVYHANYDYEHILVAPTPDAQYDFELQFYERPIPLDATNQTNWTTRYAPQLLLYGTLLEAMPFLKRPDRVAEFQALYDRALSAVLNENMQTAQGDASLMER